MDNAVYIALSKQMAQFRQMNVIANNIANADTPGYKPEFVLFHNYLVDDSKQGEVAFAQDIGEYRDHTIGTNYVTGNALDLALSSNAYFVVETPEGERYTRAGNFQLDPNNTLITPDGYPVLDAGGQPIRFQREDTDIRFAEDGMIIVNGEERGQLNIVSFENEQFLEKISGTLYSYADDPEPALGFSLQQGVLEESRVEPVLQMTEMINTMRRVSATSQFIESAYASQRRAVEVYASLQA